MAVTIKKKNPMSLLQKFGCNSDDIHKFKHYKGSIKSTDGLLVLSQDGTP